MSVMNDCGIKTKSLLGLEVAALEKEDALELVAKRISTTEKTLLVFANTNLLAALRKRDLTSELSTRCLVLNDGFGLDIISVLSGDSPFTENLNGTDLTLDFLRKIGKDARVFCFGSKKTVIASAVSTLAEIVTVVGFEHGFISNADMSFSLVERINASSPDVVLVGLGNTLQEEWMLAHADRLTARLIVCVGAFFDFTAGAVYRAPVWARRARIEWLFRLSQEPSRLWRRYTIDPAGLALVAIWGRFRPGPKPKAAKNTPSGT